MHLGRLANFQHLEVFNGNSGDEDNFVSISMCIAIKVAIRVMILYGHFIMCECGN